MDAGLMDGTPDAMAAALSHEFGVRVVSHVDEPPDHDVATPDEAIRADAESYAKDQGISIEEAIRRLELQAPAGEHGARLQALAGDRYAGHWLQHQPDYRLVFLLAGEEPASADLIALAESGPIPVTMQVGADYSFGELRAAQEQLDSVLDEEVANGLDLKQNAVTVYLFREVTAAEMEAMAADLSERLGVRVLVEQTERPSVGPRQDD